MREKLLFFLAFISHPILLFPSLFLGFNHLQFNKEFLMVLSLGLIIPIALFRILSINFKSPNLAERRIIYLILVICYALISFYFSEKGTSIGQKLFLSQSIGLLIMALATVYSKWSWHAFAWAAAIYPIIGLGFKYNLIEHYSLLVIIGGICAGLVVSYVRFLQKAHTLKELLFGYLCGALVPYICFICMDIY